MNISELIIKYSFKLAVWLIGLFYNKEPFELKVTALEKMPEGTVGKSIADCLNSHKLKLVPGYESHDLKHVVLSFAMTPLDEIRMQAFMLGNGNSSLPSLAIFLFGFLLLPHKWKTFLQDYRNGKNTIPIKHWTIEDYAAANLKQVRVKLLPAPAVNRVVNSLCTFDSQYFSRRLWYAVLPAVFILSGAGRPGGCRLSVFSRRYISRVWLG